MELCFTESNPNVDELGIEIGCNGIRALGGKEIELKMQAAFVGHELLWILSVVD